MTEVRILAKHASLTFPTAIPGCTLAACTSQDDAMPGGNGHVLLDYSATGPTSKLQLLAPGDSYGTASADLDTGNPTNVTLTSGNGRNFLVISAVTSSTIAAVHADTAYPFVCRAVGDTIFYQSGNDSLKDALTNAVRCGIDFTGANFDGLDLTGSNLAGGRFTHASFVGTKMVGCNLTSATCDYADFTGADLSGATLTSMSVTGATLTGSDELAEVAGGLTIASTSVSADYTVKDTDSVIALTSGSGSAVTVTLPTATAGRVVVVWKVDAGTTAGVVAGTINGGTNVSLGTRYHGWLFVGTGSAWQGFYLSGLVPAAVSGLATLDGSSLVVQNPANATATPTASKIPIAAATTYDLSAWGYVATTAGDWASSAPATIRAAIDRCATLLKSLNGGTGP